MICSCVSHSVDVFDEPLHVLEISREDAGRLLLRQHLYSSHVPDHSAEWCGIEPRQPPNLGAKLLVIARWRLAMQAYHGAKDPHERAERVAQQLDKELEASKGIVLATGSVANAKVTTVTLTARLSGAQEVPPADPDG